MTEPKLFLFDLDNTLSPFDTTELYPDAAQWLKDNLHIPHVIVTNQGGIGLRYQMEQQNFGDPSKFPTIEMFNARIAALWPNNPTRPTILMCARYQSKKTGQWSPKPPDHNNDLMWKKSWRKPAPGMLLAAMELTGHSPDETLMVGDEMSDLDAATAAGCQFKWTWEFFNRPAPVEPIKY